MDKNAVFPQHLQYCLDFANTMDWHASEQPSGTLQQYADLVAWAQRTKLLTEQAAQQLANQADQQPAAAMDVLEQAIDLREAIYRIFATVATEQVPAAQDLASLNAALASAYTHLQVAPTGA